MKKLLFILFISLSFIACNKQIQGNTKEYTVCQHVDSSLCVYGFASTAWLYHNKYIIYKDSTLRYVDSEMKDSVVNVIAKDFVPIYNKDVYEVVNTDTTYTNIVWYDINGIKFFFNNTTREIVMLITYIKQEYNNGSTEIYNDIYTKEMLKKEFPWMTTIDEYAKKYK